MSTPTGWYTDPADQRVQRFWDGSNWTTQRVWNGSQWVEQALAPYPQVSGAPPAKRRSRRGWWIATAVVGAVVVVVVAVTVAGGDSGSSVSKQTFCSDLDGAMSGLYGGKIVHVIQGGETDSRSAEETARIRAAISSAKHLADEAPGVPKHYLNGLARGLTASLAGREDLNAADDVDVQLAELNAWHALHCT